MPRSYQTVPLTGGVSDVARPVSRGSDSGSGDEKRRERGTDVVANIRSWEGERGAKSPLEGIESPCANDPGSRLAMARHPSAPSSAMSA